ncbi:conserved hypothetical protein [Candidatus Terasakiella magnetica]|uniref:Methyltransferase domain-containing protein n=1 Tax=Candidatus Terasakiella magnetica TaxID=1867952 RepID=A0A1C3RKK7_9PROT|nr:class I SAM-dependent methyltransferase [Candidatus Terasakiella magnetica]SCA57854.1 conserved hypothetical protein [Candidatus Terasakiella magnetica]
MERNNELFYEIAWSLRSQVFDRIIQDGPKSIFDAVEKYNQFEVGHTLKLATSYPEDDPNNYHLTGKGVFTKNDVPDALVTQKARLLVAMRLALLQRIRKLIKGEIDTIVELGCGYGINLFLLDKLINKDKHYNFVGMEFSNSGRELCAKIAKIDEQLKMKVSFIDHQEPEIPEALQFDPQKTFVFTCHSLEQIAHIPEHYFEFLTTIGHTGANIEPFGFQSDEVLEGKEAHRQYMEHQKYNMNFLEVYEKSLANNVITETERDYHISALQDDNPSSFVSWTAVK